MNENKRKDLFIICLLILFAISYMLWARKCNINRYCNEQRTVRTVEENIRSSRDANNAARNEVRNSKEDVDRIIKRLYGVTRRVDRMQDRTKESAKTIDECRDIIIKVRKEFDESREIFKKVDERNGINEE